MKLRRPMTDTQLEAFLISALIASNSLLLSVFGNLYLSLRRHRMREGSAPICKTLRSLCYCITVVIIIVATNVLYNIYLLYNCLALLAVLSYFLSLAIVLISAPHPSFSRGTCSNDART